MARSLQKEEKLKTKLRSKIKEWKYLKDSKKDFDDLFSIYECELNHVLSELSEYSKKDISSPSFVPPMDLRGNYNDDGFYESGENQKIHSPSWAKKLYKQIALQTHPDRIRLLSISDEEKIKREKIFKEAVESLKEKNYESLINFAHDLNLEVEIEDDVHLALVEKSIQKLATELKSKKELVPWVWGNLEEDPVQQVGLIFFIWEELGEPCIPQEIVEAYLKCYEENDTTDVWRIKYLSRLSKIKPEQRKHPGPSIGQIRRQKK